LELTNNHLQVIRQGIVMLECESCPLVNECQKNENSLCNEIGKWIREIEKEEEFK
jgi:hypothetical protein